jgi:aminopeptidase N
VQHWAEVWLNTLGMDTLSAVRDGASVTLRRTPGGQQVDREHAIAVAALDDSGAELDRRLVRVSDVAAVELPPGLVLPDAGDDTWARIRPDRAVPQWPDLSGIEDPVARVVLWNSIRDQVRSAELDPGIGLNVVTDSLPKEPDDLITAAILDWARGVLAGPYSRPDQRPLRMARLAATAAAILQRAAPGSDRQLSSWRSLLGCTDDVGLLRSWLAGDRLPEGRQLDAELRWRAVTRLAALTGERAVVEEEYDRDRTASGRVHRARALASLPQPAAKEAAFDRLLRPSDLSAYELYATAEGFFLPEQGELTEPFVRRFFAGMNATARFRTGWSLGEIVLRAFPASANTRVTLELAQEVLATTDLDPRVRRPVTEATDNLRRAVESLEKYAGAAEL